MRRISVKAMPINDTDYNCHTTAVEFFNQSYRVHIPQLVINSLGANTYTHTHIHTHTHTHTCIYTSAQKNNYKKPGVQTYGQSLLG